MFYSFCTATARVVQVSTVWHVFVLSVRIYRPVRFERGESSNFVRLCRAVCWSLTISWKLQELAHLCLWVHSICFRTRGKRLSVHEILDQGMVTTHTSSTRRLRVRVWYFAMQLPWHSSSSSLSKQGRVGEMGGLNENTTYQSLLLLECRFLFS